ncbi:MAG: hypothetical protein ACLVJH_15935 [Faecalibacterium prausnitzii]
MDAPHSAFGKGQGGEFYGVKIFFHIATMKQGIMEDQRQRDQA